MCKYKCAVNWECTRKKTVGTIFVCPNSTEECRAWRKKNQYTWTEHRTDVKHYFFFSFSSICLCNVMNLARRLNLEQWSNRVRTTCMFGNSLFRITKPEFIEFHHIVDIDRLKLTGAPAKWRLRARRTCPTKDHVSEGRKKNWAHWNYIDFRLVGIDTSASGCIIHTSYLCDSINWCSMFFRRKRTVQGKCLRKAAPVVCKQWSVAKFMKCEILMLIDFHGTDALLQK